MRELDMMLHNLGYRITPGGKVSRYYTIKVCIIVSTNISLRELVRGEGREDCNCISSLQLQVTHSDFSHHPRQ